MFRRLVPVLIAVIALPLLPPATSVASAAPAPITASAFGMHFLGLGSRDYPPLQFGSARIWDMGVTWRDLQPRRAGVWNHAALHRLDVIVSTFRAHHVQPLLTLGMTPRWAARHCDYHRYGQNWGLRTCAPKQLSAWRSYVRGLANRYHGKIRYFELWNEPSLANGYNDSPRTLAAMQKQARDILHSHGERLVAPSIPYTDGGPSHGLRWLDQYLSLPGGKAFDIFGVHLYPIDAAAKAGYGPEWAMNTLAQVRRVLHRHHVSKPTWNTETNVGRTISNTRFSGRRGAAMVARTYLLATQHSVARTFWYAADDRSWGGTWLENADLKSLATPGKGYRAVRERLLGARPHGCRRTTVGTHRWRFICRYTVPGGKHLFAVWSTGDAFTYRTPRGTDQVYTVTGGTRAGGRIRVGGAPIYVLGTFPL